MKSQGLGDTIKKITVATGIKKAVEFSTKSLDKECTPCEERRKALNNPNLLVNKIFYKTK
jgi:chaperonin GroEL (HSP60 family)